MAPSEQRFDTTTRAAPGPTPGSQATTRPAIGKAGKNRTDWAPEAAYPWAAMDWYHPPSQVRRPWWTWSRAPGLSGRTVATIPWARAKVATTSARATIQGGRATTTARPRARPRGPVPRGPFVPGAGPVSPVVAVVRAAAAGRAVGGPVEAATSGPVPAGGRWAPPIRGPIPTSRQGVVGVKRTSHIG